MPNQYSRLTAQNIRIKMNRARNPVRSAVQLAREFGYRTSYVRTTGGVVSAAPPTFRNRVIALVGEDTWRELRMNEFVNSAYR